ncbi:hypothetical protein V491_08398, partial [Pseudogymnoascus sp. VKM F-3775]
YELQELSQEEDQVQQAAADLRGLPGLPVSLCIW